MRESPIAAEVSVNILHWKRLSWITPGWSAIRKVWSAAELQAKKEGQSSSAQMYTASVGVKSSGLGWNALRSVVGENEQRSGHGNNGNSDALGTQRAGL